MSKRTLNHSPVWKSFFLGPAAENALWVRKLGTTLFRYWFQWRRDVFSEDPPVITEKDFNDPLFHQRKDTIREHLLELMERFQKEVPGFSPRYIGHMVSEISIPALLGHMLSLLHNPNNITDEVSRIGIQIEREAIEDLMTMLDFDVKQGRGHFCSGGTVANIEGLVRGRARMARWMAAGLYQKRNGGVSGSTLFDDAHQGWEQYDQAYQKIGDDGIRTHHFLHSNPAQVQRWIEESYNIEYQGPVVLAPQSKHYSWPKGIVLMGLGAEAFWPIELDRFGHLSVEDLKKKIARARKEHRPIVAVVSVAGTTEMGDFDPIHHVQAYLRKLRNEEEIYIWHHVDAAYGGFFKTLPRHNASPANDHLFDALDSISQTNSVTIDPHKLGYVPYSSGVFLCAREREYYITPFDAPYLRFNYENNQLPLTLEGSRAAGGAIATWLSSRCIGLNEEGYGSILEKSILQRKKLEKLLSSAHKSIQIAPHCETNILCFCIAKPKQKISESNAMTEAFYKQFYEGDPPFSVSKTSLRWSSYHEFLNNYTSQWDAEIDTEKLSMIRLTLMNPFFDDTSLNSFYPNLFVKEVVRFIEKTL